MNRILLAVALSLSAVYGAYAQFNGCGFGVCPSTFSQGINSGGAGLPPSCASPNAPDGVIDLSKCSNAFYVAAMIL